MHCHRILVSALFVDCVIPTSQLYFKEIFLISLVSFVFLYTVRYIFLNVALVVVIVVAVAVVEAAVDGVELQR